MILLKKIASAAAAVEALVIWVHPFNDGNGRTSRFLGKFIEEGGSNVEALVSETAFSGNRGTFYDSKLESREGLLADAENTEIMLDDDERDEMRIRAATLPDDKEAMYLSIKRLLADDSLRTASQPRRKNTISAAA